MILWSVMALDSSSVARDRDRDQPEDRGLSAFSPITLRKAADEVVTVLLDAIHGGVYQPGDRLPRERDLAERLDVSRATLREATDRLARAGLLNIKRGNNGGAVVLKRVADPVLLGDVASGPTEVRAILEARRPLEMAAALLACRNATEEDFADLERLVDDLADVVERDPGEGWAVDVMFHLRLGEASHNPFLAEMIREVFRRYRALRVQYPVGQIELGPAVANQRETLTAIRSRDPARTSAAMEEHLGIVEEHFLGRRIGDFVHPRPPAG